MKENELIQLKEEILIELLKKIKILVNNKLGDNSLKIYQLSQSYNVLNSHSKKILKK